MYVQVDLAPSHRSSRSRSPTTCSGFQVAVVGGDRLAPDSLAMVYAALVDAAAGRLEGDDAWIAVDAVRRMAQGRVGPGWDADLDGMLDYRAHQGLARRERLHDPRPRRVGVTPQVLAAQQPASFAAAARYRRSCVRSIAAASRQASVYFTWWASWCRRPQRSPAR